MHKAAAMTGGQGATELADDLSARNAPIFFTPGSAPTN